MGSGTHRWETLSVGRRRVPGNRSHESHRAEGEIVQKLQEQIAERGHDVGEVDGKYGHRTRDTVAAFQEEHGLTPDSIVGPATAEEFELDIDVQEVEEVLDGSDEP